jgi:hypothetical protein
MEIVHWIGVLLALPASAVVLTAVWRSSRRADHRRPLEPPHES